MKKLILILFIIFATSVVFSQESDKKALDLLEQVVKKTKSYEGFKADFTFTVHNLHDSTKKSYNGEMWFRDKNYKLKMMNSVIYSDGETNWVYQKDVGEINITDKEEKEQSNFINPYKFMENYQEDFTCRFVSDRFEYSRPLVEIHLFPEDIEDANYSRIKLKIDKVKKQLYKFIFAGNEGVNYILTISRLYTEKPVTRDSVMFNKENYPDAEIIDMR